MRVGDTVRVWYAGDSRWWYYKATRHTLRFHAPETRAIVELITRKGDYRDLDEQHDHIKALNILESGYVD